MALLTPAPVGTPGAAVASVTSVVNPTTLTPGTGSGYAVGNTLLCFTACRSATPTVATPPGWTSLLNVTGTNGRLALFGKVAASTSEAAPSVVWSGLTTGNSGTPVQARVAAFSGIAPLNDVVGTVANGAASTATSAGGAAVTTTKDNDLVLSLTTRLDDAFTTFTAPSGFTNVTAAFGTPSGADFAMAWAYQVKATAGSVGAADFGLTGATSFASSGVMIALRAGVSDVPADETSIDNFNRADGPIYAGAGASIWEAFGGVANLTGPILTTASNQMAGGNSGGVFANSKVQLDTSFDLLFDVPVAPIGVPGVLVNFGIADIGTSGWDGWQITIGTTWNIAYVTNNSSTTVAFVAFQLPSAGSTVWIAKRGTVITLYYRTPAGAYVQVLTASDSRGNIASPFVLRLYEPSTRLDNLRGGPLVSGGIVYNDSCSGTIAFTASIVDAKSVSDTLSGTAAFTGTRVERKIGTDAQTGALGLSGSIVESYGKFFFDAPTGAITLSGAAADRKIVSDSRTGTVVLSGSAVDVYVRPIIYVDAPTGVIACTGSRTETLSRLSAPAGTVVTSGSIVESIARRYVDAPTGSIVITGTSVDSWARTNVDTCSGTLSLTGTRVENRAYLDVCSGALLLTGTKTERKTIADSATGIIPVAGTMTEARGYVDSRSGTLLLTGSAVDVYIRPTIYNDAPTGSVITSGTRTEASIRLSAPAGALVLSGTRVESWARINIDAATGTIILSGASVDSWARTASDAPTGTLLLSGSLSLSRRFSDARTGVLVLTGSSTERKIYSDSRIGSIVLAGTASVSRSYLDNVSGIIVVIGYIQISDVVNGTILLSGSVTENLIKLPALVKALFAASDKPFPASTQMDLTGSLAVGAGNTILIGFSMVRKAGAAGVGAISAIDNLGNTYSVLRETENDPSITGTRSAVLCAPVTNPGTLTLISITHPSLSDDGRITIAGEFANVGALRAVGGSNNVSSATNLASAYPGPAYSNEVPYVAGDLLFGVFAAQSQHGFSVNTDINGVTWTKIGADRATSGSSGNSNVSEAAVWYAGGAARAGARLAATVTGTTLIACSGVAMLPKIVGTTYNDTSTGGIGLSGSATDSLIHRIVFTDAVSGTIIPAGSLTRRSIFTNAVTGVLVLSGTVVERRGRNDAVSGNIVLSGSASERKSYNDAPTGTLVLTGSCAVSHRYTDARSGIITIAGTTSERYARADVATGTLQMWGWEARTLPPGTPRPVGIPGVLAASAPTVVNPTVLRPLTGTDYEIGDVLVCFAAGGNSLTSSTPGWTVIANTANLYLLAKMAASLEEPAPVLTFSATPGAPGASGTPVSARIVAFRGLDTRNMTTIAEIIGASNTIFSVGQSAGGQAITTAYDNDLVLSLTRRDIGSLITRVAPPTGFGLLAWDFLDSGQRMTSAWAYLAKLPAGLVSAPLFTVSTADASNYSSTGIAIALKAVPLSSHAPVGMLLLSGSRVESKRIADTASGIILLSGTVVESYAKAGASAPVGTLPLTGAALSVHKTVKNDAPAGQIILSGGAIDKRGRNDVVNGTLPLNGSRTEGRVHNDARSGAILLSGSCIDSYLKAGSDTPSGQIPLNGTRLEAHTARAAVAGRIVLNGSCVDQYFSVRSDAPSGTISLSGTRTERRGYTDIPVGLIRLLGSSTLTRNYDDIRSGTLSLAGGVSESWSVLGRTFYNDFPSGRIVLTGRLITQGRVPVFGYLATDQVGNVIRQHNGRRGVATVGRRSQAITGTVK